MSFPGHTESPIILKLNEAKLVTSIIFSKMECRDGSAKTTGTRCRDGCVYARQAMYIKTTVYK